MTKSKILKKDIKLPSKYVEEIEKRIAKFLFKEIYAPILKAGRISKKKLENSNDPILQALRTNQISYWQGQFRGKFDARVSAALKELGAQWDQANATFRLTLNEMPDYYVQAVKATELRFAKKFARINEAINAVNTSEAIGALDLTDLFDKSIFKLDKDINKALENITVAPQLDAFGREQLAREYNLDLKKYIKDFSDKQVNLLREMVRQNFNKGIRYNELVEDIQDRFKVSRSKAKFLARQETNLVVSKFKEIRFRDAGSDEYVWKTVAGSPNHPVRPDHKRLDNTTQRWDNPPVTNLKTGARNHAGEDYNCRCYAQPVFTFE